MTLLKSIKTCLGEKYFSFSGRASRSEFWWFWLFQAIACSIALVISEIVFLILLVVLIVPSISVATRRYHDLGKSGWWLLLGLIPLVGLAVLLFCAREGDHIPNKYGQPPEQGNKSPGEITEAPLPKIDLEHINTSNDFAPAPTPLSAFSSTDSHTSEKRSPNYFVRNWRGDLSLGVTYWVNGTLIAGILPMSVIAVLTKISDDADSLRLVAILWIFSVTVLLVLWLWSTVGIWRSSNNHVARGGKAVWASLARVAVVLGAISGAGQLVATYIPMLRAMTPLALGNDPLGDYKATFSNDGKSIHISGVLRAGSAKEIEKLIDSAPAINVIVLSSNGGRLLEGQLLAKVVTKRGLSTYVEQICASTCTFVFLAGKERAATPTAKIGFHTPTFPGNSPEYVQAGTQLMMQQYQKAGIPKQFLDKVKSTPTTSMWYPTRAELIDAHVITRVSLGGETTVTFTGLTSKKEFLLLLRSIPLWQAIEKRFPDALLTSLDRGWKVKEQGGNDNQVMAAMRSVVAELIPTILRESDTKYIESFVKLLINQMRIARTVSYEACQQLLNGQLNPIAVFPKEVNAREQQLLFEGLSSQPMLDRQFNKLAVDEALAAAVSKISPAYLDVVVNPTKYQRKPALVCDSMIALYEAIVSLPSAQKDAALEGMFKTGG